MAPEIHHNPETSQNPAICVIVLRDALIGMDLSTTIADARPGVQVLWVKTPEEASCKLSTGLRIAAAFVDVGPEEFMKTALSARIAGDGAVLVFLGPDIAKEAVSQMRNRIRVLTYPFSMADVLGVITDLPMK
jgi:hypothetical protein